MVYNKAVALNATRAAGGGAINLLKNHFSRNTIGRRKCVCLCVYEWGGGGAVNYHRLLGITHEKKDTARAAIIIKF